MSVATVEQRLERDDALLTRTDLAELGLPRRAIDSLFAALPIVRLPGYARSFVRAADYRAYVAEHTYGRGEVMPS